MIFLYVVKKKEERKNENNSFVIIEKRMGRERERMLFHQVVTSVLKNNVDSTSPRGCCHVSLISNQWYDGFFAKYQMLR